MKKLILLPLLFLACSAFAQIKNIHFDYQLTYDMGGQEFIVYTNKECTALYANISALSKDEMEEIFIDIEGNQIGAKMKMGKASGTIYMPAKEISALTGQSFPNASGENTLIKITKTEKGTFNKQKTKVIYLAPEDDIEDTLRVEINEKYPFDFKNIIQFFDTLSGEEGVISADKSMPSGVIVKIENEIVLKELKEINKTFQFGSHFKFKPLDMNNQ